MNRLNLEYCSGPCRYKLKDLDYCSGPCRYKLKAWCTCDIYRASYSEGQHTTRKLLAWNILTKLKLEDCWIFSALMGGDQNILLAIGL
jgi:hypothetical protein